MGCSNGLSANETNKNYILKQNNLSNKNGVMKKDNK